MTFTVKQASNNFLILQLKKKLLSWS